MAENIEPSPAKRPRKPNFTPAECAVIFEEAEENLSIINPFAPEPPVTARADPGPFYPLSCHQF